MRLNPGLLGKELREARWKWIIGGGALLVTALLLPFGFDILRSFLSDAPPLPEAWGSLVSSQLGDYTTYLWMNWYGKNLFQLVVVIAVLLGAAPLAGERSRRSMEFLLSQPISRATIFQTKYVSGLTLLWSIIIVTTVAMGPSSAAAGHSLDLLRFIRGLPVTLAGASLFYAISWVYSALLSEEIKAVLAGGATCAALIVIGWIPALKPVSLSNHLAAAQTLQSNDIRWDVTLVLLGLSLVCIGVAWRIFKYQRTMI